MDSGRFHISSFVNAIIGLVFNALTETVPEEKFNVVRRHVDQPAGCKSELQMLRCPEVGFMGFQFADWRFRIVFQEEIRPLAKGQIFSPSDNFQEVSVPGLKPLPEFLLGFMPVLRAGGLFLKFAIPVSVSHPRSP